MNQNIIITRWAVLVTLVAMILGGTVFAAGTTQPQLNFNFKFSISPLIRQIENLLYNTLDLGYIPELDQIFQVLYRYATILNLILTISSIAALLSLAAIVIAGPMRYGYSRWCLQMLDAEPRSHFGVLFSGFKNFGKALGLYWWIWLKIFLWGLLSGLILLIGWLIIGLIFGLAFTAAPDLAYMDPGAAILSMLPTIILIIILSWAVTIAAMLPAIVAEYRYAMSYYLLIENPNMPATEAVNCSKRLMKGNKWRLFCLHLSFIGWHILNALSFGILGILFLNPYHEMAVAAFYRDLVPAQPASQLWHDAPKVPQGYRPVPQQGYSVPASAQPVQTPPQPAPQAPTQNPPAQNNWYTPAAPSQPSASPADNPGAAPQASANPFADLPPVEQPQQPDWGTPPEAPNTPWQQ